MMMKKKGISMVLGLGVLALGLAGCGSGGGQQAQQMNYSQDTYGQEASVTEQQQANFDKTQPAPKLSYSLQRQNLITRLKMMNNPNRVSYIYLMSNYGNIVSFYVVKGAVSSLNEHLTTQSQLVLGAGKSQYGPYSHVVNSPSLDGTYGNQGTGIFFFTETGAMIQWGGNYLWSTQPLTVHAQPILTQSVAGKP
jgi:hypothetical protein